MSPTVTGAEPRALIIASEREPFVCAFRHMLLARTLDEKLASLYRAGKIHGGVFLGRGQEALSAALGLALREGDIFAPLIRDAAGRLAFGETVEDSLRTYLGSALGPMRGRDGNVHRGRPRHGYLPMISHLGAMISVVNGALLARRLKGISGTLGAASIGDGATSTGSFHEALNQAAVEQLPLLLVVADNQYAYSTPTSRQFACSSLVDRAEGYGVRGHTVDGTDLEECLRVINTAAAAARGGPGPQLVVAHLLRLCGHGEHDDSHYIDPQLRQSMLGRDCIEVAYERLVRRGWIEPGQLDLWRQQATQEVEDAVARVQQEPAPDPYREEWTALSTARLRE
jgi:pyruvate dehydrogenase E1 component alpha subunit/2-oxoisovalerate dehydrogenase E1 component alpha subunit